MGSAANLVLLQSQMQSTAGSIPLLNENGAVPINKVKFLWFQSERKSKYASDKNNEEESVGEFPFEKKREAAVPETEINEETKKLELKLRELLPRGQVDDDDDDKKDSEPYHHSHKAAAAEEPEEVKETEALPRRWRDDEENCDKAQINPAQLLDAPDFRLSINDGIKSIEDVPELVRFLDKGGWEIINTWLQGPKSSSSDSFLIEILKLCKLLPMTISRLKENNTGKLIKTLMKHKKDEIKHLSSELVNFWTSVIREKSSEITGDKKKKRDKSVKTKKDKAAKSEPVKDETKSSDKSVTGLKEQGTRKGVKRLFVERENKKPEMYEDVKIDPELLIPVSKKSHTDRPKTAKICQKKFRAIGLEEKTPLPNNISEKPATVDKSAVAVKNALKLNTSSLDTVTEKKIKLESLIMTIHENASTKGNTKLSPPKPRSTYVLQESENFFDNLMSQLQVPYKRQKNVALKTHVTTASPTSSPRTVLNLQFYKNTLEINAENKKESEKADTPSLPNNESNSENIDPAREENTPMDTTEEGGRTPMNDESNGTASPTDDSKSKDENSSIHGDPNLLRSILSHGRRKGKKKNVRWVNDENIEQIFYFEMDDTERVNVARNLQSLKMKREIEDMEMARRYAGNQIGWWWTIPVLIDLQPPLAIPGCNSEAKNIEIMRQQSTLEELYFTREMIPESPHEPDLEIVAPKEPKVIPLDEISTDPQPNKSLLIKSEPLLPQNTPLLGNQPNEPGPKPILGNKKSFLGDPPVRTPQGLPSNEQFFGRFPLINKNGPLLPQPPGIGIRPPTHNIHPNFRGGPSNNVRPPINRKICRHFVAKYCRFGMNCAFRHPGVNCPL